MEKSVNSLFKLIKSLTRNEKILFKIFCNEKSKKKDYLLLFDIIDSFKEYDETLLQNRWKKKRGAASIKDAKKYLKESVFRFLEHHYFEHSISIQLQRYLQRIEILFDKGLLVLARKQLVKAEHLAFEYQQYPYLFAIQQWNRKLVFRLTNFRPVKDTVKGKKSNELQSIHQYKNFVEYQTISDEINNIMMSKGDHLDKRSIARLTKILNKPSLSNENKAFSVYTKYLYWGILVDIHFLLKNWEKGYTCCKWAIGYFEKGRVTPHERLKLYAKLVTALNNLNKAEELEFVKMDAKKLIESLPQKSLTDDLYNMYISLLSNYINCSIKILNINEALFASDEILDLAEKHISPQNFLVYNCHRFLLFFYSANYRKALQSINSILGSEGIGVRQDIVSDMKIFNLITHYELGNEEVILKLCKSHNYFDKKKLPNKTETALLNFFGAIINKNTRNKNRISAFIKLKKELILCTNEEIHREFDFISWIDSKIQKRLMIDILKGKVEIV